MMLRTEVRHDPCLPIHASRDKGSGNEWRLQRMEAYVTSGILTRRKGSCPYVSLCTLNEYPRTFEEGSEISTTLLVADSANLGNRHPPVIFRNMAILMDSR